MSVTLLTIIPVVLAAFIAVALLIFSTQTIEKRNFACQKSLLESQLSAGKTIQRLLDLNKVVLSLRVSLGISYALLATATATYNGALAAKAINQINQIKKQQQNLKKLQQSLLQFASLEMKSAPLRFDHRLTKLPPELFKVHTTFMFRSAQPAVEEQDKGFDPPTYKIKENFETAQTTALQWRAQWNFGGFQWIQRLTKIKGLVLERSCGGTLENSSSLRGFDARLIEVKS